jgi:hypothetical protein
MYVFLPLDPDKFPFPKEAVLVLAFARETLSACEPFGRQRGGHILNLVKVPNSPLPVKTIRAKVYFSSANRTYRGLVHMGETEHFIMGIVLDGVNQTTYTETPPTEKAC